MAIPIIVLGDTSSSDPCGAPARPNAQGSATTTAEGKPVHCQTHAWKPHSCPGEPPHDATTTSGSGVTTVDGLPLARIGDTISCGSTCAVSSVPHIISD